MDVDELKERVEKLEGKISDAHKEIYTRLHDIENTLGRTDERYKAIEKALEEQKDQLAKINETLEELKSKPARRWDHAVSSAISGIVGAVLGALLGRGM